MKTVRAYTASAARLLGILEAKFIGEYDYQFYDKNAELKTFNPYASAADCELLMAQSGISVTQYEGHVVAHCNKKHLCTVSLEHMQTFTGFTGVQLRIQTTRMAILGCADLIATEEYEDQFIPFK